MKALERYIEGLTITQGPLSGQRVKLLPWEKQFLKNTFRPGVGTAALSIGRANGKSSLVAAIGAACVDGPLRVPRGEVVVCASSFTQARIVFEHTLAFLQPVIDLDKSAFGVQDSTAVATIEHRETGARLRCIGSDPRRAHGLAPALVLFDEPAQFPPGTSDKMLSALLTAQGKIPGSRFVALGTLPDNPDHWFMKMCEGGADYAQVYQCGADDNPHSPRAWAKANPSMRYWPTLRKAIKDDSERGKKDLSLMPAFRALRLNMGVADNPEDVLLEASTWTAAEVKDVEKSGPYVLGLDLGTSASQTAAAAYFPRTGSLDAFAVWPSVPSLRERAIHDNAGGLYDDLRQRGELLILGQHTSDIAAMLQEVLRRWGRPTAIVIDRWRQPELLDRLQDVDFPLSEVITRGMGWLDGSVDCRAFQRAFLDGKVRPRESRLLRAAMADCHVASDPAGNIKIAKRRHGKSRDDAVVASVLAVAEGTRRGDVKPRRWRSRGTT